MPIPCSPELSPNDSFGNTYLASVTTGLNYVGLGVAVARHHLPFLRQFIPLHPKLVAKSRYANVTQIHTHHVSPNETSKVLGCHCWFETLKTATDAFFLKAFFFEIEKFFFEEDILIYP